MDDQTETRQVDAADEVSDEVLLRAGLAENEQPTHGQCSGGMGDCYG